MKIIRDGVPIDTRAESRLPWIYRQDICCPRCSCIWRLEEGDVFLLSRSLSDPTAAVTCPQCKYQFDVRPEGTMPPRIGG